MYASVSFPVGLSLLNTLPPSASLSGVQLSGLSGQFAPAGASTLGMSPLFESPTLDPLVLPGPNPTGLDLNLSISLCPVPGRLVQLIRSGRFIEMRDLLYDNSTLRGHYEGLHGSTGLQLLPVSSRPRVREVTTLSSWICCYLTYCAVQAPDQATRDRMTYAILVVREAMRHGGQGWLYYDRLFRQQAAINPGLQWNAIHPQLQATTVLN